jgi:hypothetical protein
MGQLSWLRALKSGSSPLVQSPRRKQAVQPGEER